MLTEVHTQSATYAVGDVLTLTSGAVWRVDRVWIKDGRASVGLDDPANPGKHGTAFYADVLDRFVRHHRPGVSVAESEQSYREAVQRAGRFRACGDPTCVACRTHP